MNFEFQNRRTLFSPQDLCENKLGAFLSFCIMAVGMQLPNKSKKYPCRMRHFAWCSPSSVPPYVSPIGGLLGEATKFSIPTAPSNHSLSWRIRKYGGNWVATFLSMVGVLTWLLFYATWTFFHSLALCLCSLHVFLTSEITIRIPEYISWYWLLPRP